DAIYNGLRAQEERKQIEADEKRARAEARSSKKVALARLEEEWKTIKDEHEHKLADWKLTCKSLQNDGVPKKNWPKAPTQPRKPKLSPNFAAVGDNDDDDYEEIDNN
ncbi:hypothetical protein FA15DRAFT_558328, partial [Coprinopsis marcescibilis]